MTTGYGRPDRQLGSRDFFSFVPALVIFISTLYAAFLLFFLSYFNRTVPMHKCSEEHSHMSSAFPIGILNGTCIFRKAMYSLLLP